MSESKNYPFQLEKHPKKKGVCPECGEHNQFRYYQDLNGNRLNEFGRCERVSSCGYHVWPTGKAVPKTPGDYTPPPLPVQLYPDTRMKGKLEGYLLNQDSRFHHYCLSIGISYGHLAKWRVGTEGREGKGLLTVFLFVDQYQQLVNAKWFLYDENGKRNKDFDSYSLRQPKNDDKDLSPQRYSLCLYGEHLLDPAAQKPVALVESEKTAVIASWFYPQFDWIAVGSCNGLTDAKIQAIVGRCCYWFADADGDEIKMEGGKPKISKVTGKTERTTGGRRNSSIDKLKKYAFRHEIIDLFPGRTDGYDMADAIRDQAWPYSKLPEIDKIILPTDVDDDESEAENVEEDFSDEWDYIQGIDKAFFYRKETQKNYRRFGFVEYKNRYWFGTIHDKEGVKTLAFKEVSNFIVKPLLLIESNNDPKRVYEITNIYGDSKVYPFSPKEFASPAGFGEKVESLGNFNFWATKGQYTKLKNKLYELCLSAAEIKTLGYHSDGFYAFCNGIQNSQWVPLDKDGYGIVEHKGQRYFLPALSKIYIGEAEEYQNHKRFVKKEPKDPISFTEYAKRFCAVYALNGNGQIGLLFYIACLFRDIVFTHFRFFPHLFLFGPPQTGKSSIAWSIMYLFGDTRMPFMLNTGTSVAFYKQFAEFCNAVVWFDEYQNAIDYTRVQSLKTAYDGAGHTKSDNTKDNRNKSIPVKSGCIVSGQELPTADVALFTRTILLQFTKTDYTPEEKDVHSLFNQQVEQKGVSHLTAYLSQFRDDFAHAFLKHFDVEFSLIKKHFERRGIDDRITKNMSILLSTYQCLRDKVEFPFTEEQLRQTAYQTIASQNALITGSKETSTFWKMVMFMYRSRLIKFKLDFRIDLKVFLDIDVSRGQPDQRHNLIDADHPTGRKVLLIRLTNIHTFYQKLCRERGEKSMDEGSLRHYLINMKGYLCKVRGIRFGKTSSTALAFDYEYLQESIEDFNLDDLEDDDEETKPAAKATKIDSQSPFGSAPIDPEKIGF